MRHRENRITAGLALTAVLLMSGAVIGCGGGGSTYSSGGTGSSLVQMVSCPSGTAGTDDVSIQDFSFTPSSTTIPVNTIVKWTNNGPSTHTVTSTTTPANGSFDSGNLVQSTSICYKFLAAGTYTYRCSIHPQMTGSVVVQ